MMHLFQSISMFYINIAMVIQAANSPRNLRKWFFLGSKIYAGGMIFFVKHSTIVMAQSTPLFTE